MQLLGTTQTTEHMQIWRHTLHRHVVSCLLGDACKLHHILYSTTRTLQPYVPVPTWQDTLIKVMLLHPSVKNTKLMLRPAAFTMSRTLTDTSQNAPIRRRSGSLTSRSL